MAAAQASSVLYAALRVRWKSAINVASVVHSLGAWGEPPDTLLSLSVSSSGQARHSFQYAKNFRVSAIRIAVLLSWLSSVGPCPGASNLLTAFAQRFRNQLRRHLLDRFFRDLAWGDEQTKAASR